MRPQREAVNVIIVSKEGERRIRTVYPMRILFDKMRGENRDQWLLQWWDKSTNQMHYTPMADVERWELLQEAAR